MTQSANTGPRLPLILTAEDLLRSSTPPTNQPLHTYENCRFTAAHYNMTPFAGSMLVLDEVLVDLGHERLICIRRACVLLVDGFFKMVRTPGNSRVSIDIHMQQPIPMHRVPMHPKGEANLPPGQIQLAGLTLYSSNLADLDEWEASLADRRTKDAAGASIIDVLERSMLRLPRAPQP